MLGGGVNRSGRNRPCRRLVSTRDSCGTSLLFPAPPIHQPSLYPPSLIFVPLFLLPDSSSSPPLLLELLVIKRLHGRRWSEREKEEVQVKECLCTLMVISSEFLQIQTLLSLALPDRRRDGGKEGGREKRSVISPQEVILSSLLVFISSPDFFHRHRQTHSSPPLFFFFFSSLCEEREEQPWMSTSGWLPPFILRSPFDFSFTFQLVVEGAANFDRSVKNVSVNEIG